MGSSGLRNNVPRVASISRTYLKLTISQDETLRNPRIYGFGPAKLRADPSSMAKRISYFRNSVSPTGFGLGYFSSVFMQSPIAFRQDPITHALTPRTLFSSRGQQCNEGEFALHLVRPFDPGRLQEPQ
jgi:hypothetical protein